MRRRPLQLAALLAIASLMTVVVAWASVAGPTANTSYQVNILDTHRTWWTANTPTGWSPAPPKRVSHKPRIGVLQVELSSERAQYVATRTLAGWPFYSLEGATWSDLRTGRSNLSRGTFVLQDMVGIPGLRWRFPARLRWPQAIANAIVYAILMAIPYVYWHSRVNIIAYVRRRRGACAACGYPVGPSPVCSECGRSI